MGIQIKKIKTWGEKAPDGIATGSLRIYAGGGTPIGWAEPIREDKDRYKFRHNCLEGIVSVPSEILTLEEILMHVELSLKEFIKKVAIVKSVS